MFLAHKLNVSDVKKLVFFDNDVEFDTDEEESASCVTLPKNREYDDYGFLDDEADDLDHSQTVEFLNSSIKEEQVVEAPKDEIPEETAVETPPEIAVPMPEKIEKQPKVEEKKVAEKKVPKVSPVTIGAKVSPVVVTPVAKVERKRSREQPEKVPEKTAEEPEAKTAETGTKEAPCKTSHSAPAVVAPIVPAAVAAPVAKPPPMSWAAMAKRSNPQEQGERKGTGNAREKGTAQPNVDEAEKKNAPKFDPMAKRISEILWHDTNDKMSKGYFIFSYKIKITLPSSRIGPVKYCRRNIVLLDRLGC